MNKPSVYLDYNATTPLHPLVKEALVEGFELYANPSSLHEPGRKARNQIERVRQDTAAFLGAEPDEIIFTGGGSESNNTVLKMLTCPGCPGDCIWQAGQEIITSAVEHPSVLNTVQYLSSIGRTVHILPVDGTGKLDLAKFRATLSERTGLVSIMMANNEIGTIDDIKTIASLAHEHGALVHTDAVQAVGRIPVNVKDLGVDYLSFSAHKFYGPKGIGVLYGKRAKPFCTFIHGGHQEQGRRAGTTNTLGIIGLGKALALVKDEMGETMSRVRVLRDRLKAGVERRRESERPPDGQPGQYLERLLHRGRGRGDPSLPRPRGHRRLYRFGLLVRLARAVARAPRHRRGARARPWLDPLQPGPRDDGGGDRLRPGRASRRHRTGAQNVDGLHEELLMSDFDWVYTEKVKDHFTNPRNILEDEAAFAPDGRGVVGNIKCGDQMLMAIKVKGGAIEECRWKTYGCASAIASTSMLSEMVKGMTLEQAYQIKPTDIVRELGALPEHKIHCSVLGDRALRAAIEDYYQKTGQGDKVVREQAVIVCQCMNVTDKDIERAVKDGAHTYEELQYRTKLGTVCGQCKLKAEELLHEYTHLYG
jgi:cysteine desulfurase